MAGAQGPIVSERRRRGIYDRGTRQLQREVEADSAGPLVSASREKKNRKGKQVGAWGGGKDVAAARVEFGPG
jgi:hypothetical protein